MFRIEGLLYRCFPQSFLNVWRTSFCYWRNSHFVLSFYYYYYYFFFFFCVYFSVDLHAIRNLFETEWNLVIFWIRASKTWSNYFNCSAILFYLFFNLHPSQSNLSLLLHIFFFFFFLFSILSLTYCKYFWNLILTSPTNRDV